MDGKRIPFTSDDEAKIASAATWGSILAIASLIGGGISLVTTAMNSAGASGELQTELSGQLFATSIVVILNVWLLQACQAFRKVALTDEADQAYLLAGFRKLRAYFMTTVILILVALGLSLLGIGALASMF